MDDLELKTVDHGESGDIENVHFTPNIQPEDPNELVSTLKLVLETQNQEIRQLVEIMKSQNETIRHLERKIERLRPCCLVQNCCRLKLCLKQCFEDLQFHKWSKKKSKRNRARREDNDAASLQSV